jgi:uncharacterized membrane protein YkoI
MRHTKILTTTAIISGIILAAQVALGNGISILPFAKQGAEAQMMGGNDTSMMKSGDRMTKMGGGNITGSVDLISVISEAIGSKVNVSLSDAATSAETSVGNESHAVSAELGENSGFLVYNIMVIDPNMNFSKVVVDPGTGEVLLSEPISREQHMMMHGMGMDKQGMMSPGMMGPGMMMGPPSGMMGGYPR